MDCVHCKQEINPLRLKALPNTITCVECSTTSPKRGVVATFGEKDHTWNDVVFLDDNQYDKYLKSQKKVRFDKIEEEGDDNKKNINLNNLEE